MANYTSSSFLLPLNPADKIIQIKDRFNLNRISLNGQSVKTTLVISNIIKIDTLDQIIQLDFVSNSEAKLALSLLQGQIDMVRFNFPVSITGPIGPKGNTGSQGTQGATGPAGILYLNYNGVSYSIIDNVITLTQSQSDWGLTNSNDPSFILNKPDLTKIGGVQQYGSINYFPNPGNPLILYIDLSTNLSWYWATQSSTYSCVIDIFQNDIPVSLSNGKTFGRYTNGTTISAIGKTPAQIILDATIEPISPSVSISTSPTSLVFNQPNPIITLNFGYTINSLGAIADTALLQYYSNNSSTWITIYNTINNNTTYNITGFTYAIPNIDNPQFNTTSFQFRYLVTDTLSATNSSYSNVNISSYIRPTISNFLGSASNINLSIESNNIREIGNTSTILKGSVSRISTYVPILYYQYFIKINVGSYTSISPTYSISSTGGSFINYIDTSATSSATNVTYQVVVTDSYTTSTTTYAINYNYVIFYGSINTASTNSSGIRSNSNYQFINGLNPFILNTGAIKNIYEIALPSSHNITSVIDLDSLNADITSNYILSIFNVNNGGGTPTLYNIYDMVNGIPYPSNHRHQINYN